MMFDQMNQIKASRRRNEFIQLQLLNKQEINHTQPNPTQLMEKNETLPSKYDVNAKWDACLDLTVRRFVYSSLAGAFSGLLLFRSPVTRWASVAFGAGVGVGSAYIESSHIFNGSPATLETPKSTDASTPLEEQK